MAEPALSIRGLTKVYGNGFNALKGIDLDVAEGDFFALLGPNGAGKSTTLGIVSSLVQKTAGKVSVFGIDIDRDFAKAKLEQAAAKRRGIVIVALRYGLRDDVDLTIIEAEAAIDRL